LKQFDSIVDGYPDVTQVPFLNAYLAASATAMGIDNISACNASLDISSDDYNSKEEAYKDYIYKLQIYSEDTKNERLDFHCGNPKIRNKIINYPPEGEKTTALCAKGQGLRPGKLKFSQGKFSRPEALR
jgi:hypothetical protein